MDLFQLLSSPDVNWWTGVVWIIVMFLSAVWTLILTAPIHCRASIAEQLMECYISSNLFWWINKTKQFFFYIFKCFFPLTFQLWMDLRDRRFPEGFRDSYPTEVRNLILPSDKYWLDRVYPITLLCFFFRVNSSWRCCHLHQSTGHMQKT